MGKIIIYTISLLSFCSISFAESTDSINQFTYIGLGTANDLFQTRTHSDKYFSASFFGTFAHQCLNNKTAQKLLIGQEHANDIFGLSIAQNGYTPENLSISQVDSSDRPYAGTLELSYWRKNFSAQQNIQYLSAFSIGVSGPIAQVEAVQSGIHKITGDLIPQGWHNQIGNGLIIQYQADAEYLAIKKAKHIRLGLGAYGNIGSFVTSTASYANLRVGFFKHDYFAQNGINQHYDRLQCYANFILMGRAVLYDGTLQGSLLPFQESPYTLEFNDYKHITSSFTYKVTLAYGAVHFSYLNFVEVDRYFLDGIFSFGAFYLTYSL